MSVDEALDDLDLEQVGNWALGDDDPDEQMRWYCETGELLALPPTEDASATVELHAPVAGEIAREAVWRERGEWMDVLRQAVSWMREHPYGTPVGDPEIARDVGEWEFDAGVYTRHDDEEMLVPMWRWRKVREQRANVRAVVTRGEGEYVLRIIDDEEREEQVVFADEDSEVVAEDAVDWLEEYDSGVTLGRKEVGFGARERANEWRDRLEDYVLTGAYDRRHKTVELYPDLVDDVTVSDMVAQAMDGRADSGVTYGQIPLSDHEVKRIRKKKDYTHQDRFTARAVKAIAAKKGVNDWTVRFEPNLTADEHIGKFDDVVDDVSGEVHEDEHGEIARSAHDTEHRRQGHAKRACKNGRVEACEYLLERDEATEDELRRWADENDELAEVLPEVLGE